MRLLLRKNGRGPALRPSGSKVERERDETRRCGGREWQEFGAVDSIVERVAFDGDAAGSADEAFQFGARRKFRSLGAGVVINLFFHNCSIEIVGTEAKGNLRDAWREHDPVSLDVLEVVEQQARDGDVAEVVVTGRLRNVRERGVVGMKREGNESDEAVRDVL